MIINPYKYPFIVLEGPDGCGKDTVVASLDAYCNERGINVAFTVEPTAGKYGREVRSVLGNKGMDASGRKLSSDEIQLLFVRDRLVHRLDEQEWLRSRPVFSNRDWESTCAYYRAFGGDIADIVRMHEEEFDTAAGEFFVADLTVIVDIEPAEAQRRQKELFAKLGKEMDHFEDDIKKRENIREAYLALPGILTKLDVPHNIKIVNGMQSKDQVFADVLAHIRAAFREKIGVKF